MERKCERFFVMAEFSSGADEEGYSRRLTGLDRLRPQFRVSGQTTALLELDAELPVSAEVPAVGRVGHPALPHVGLPAGLGHRFAHEQF